MVASRRAGRTARGETRGRARLGLALTIALATGSPPSRAEEAPRAVVTDAQRALDAGDAAKALALVRDLAASDRAPSEALLVAARAAERTGAKVDALAWWRRLLARAAEASPPLTAVVDEAAARVLVLSPFEAEVRRLRTSFVAACAGLAEKALDSDPGLERRAWRAVVAADGRDDRARRRLAALGVDVHDPVAAGRDERHVPAWVGRWRDLVEDGSFGAAAQANRVAPLDEAGAYTRPSRSVDTGARYVLELELRVWPTAPTWMFGLVFGNGGGGTCSAFVELESVVADEGRGAGVAVLGRAHHAGASPGVWHRLAVIVVDRRFDVWFDGQPYLRGLAPADGDLSGDVAVLRRDCRGEIRGLRIGSPP